MRYLSRLPDNGSILLDEGENEYDALRAVAQASFATAPPIRTRPSGYRKSDALSVMEAGIFLTRDSSWRLSGLEMGIVRGRRCDTSIYRDSHDFNVWVLDKTRFMLRGSNDYQVFHQAASALLHGVLLDRRLAHFQLSRSYRESDWDFRRRAFSSLWERSPYLALSILLGSDYDSRYEFDRDKITHLLLCKPSREVLEQFSASFDDDPLNVARPRQSR